MPLPTPNDGETHDDWIDRCMGNEAMLEEFPENDQRYAICQERWEDKDKESAPEPEKPPEEKAAPLTAIERRILEPEDAELRVVEGKNGKPAKLAGYAARFNKLSVDMGGFRERIRKGAFGPALAASDVRGLKNHDPNLLLGRTKSGTLRLTENARGLKFELDLPDTQTGRDVAEEIRRGDISGCSFSFTLSPGGEAWEEDEETGEIRELVTVKELFDVGPVTYPAYPDTEVAIRSRERWQAQRDQELFANVTPCRSSDPDETAQAPEEPEEPEAREEAAPEGESEGLSMDDAKAMLDAAKEVERQRALKAAFREHHRERDI